jgi:hypothetical protein
MTKNTNSVNGGAMPVNRNAVMRDRRHFIGGSDARIIMGKDEKALLRCGAKNVERPPPSTCRAS